ncbi:MAG: alginate export family protein [Candidatus Omnitrophota bacterium]
MGKRLILILALAFVVCVTAAAYAEVQNVKVSGDITAEAVARNNLILRKENKAPATYAEYNDRISGLLSHIRVRVDADLTDNVSTTVRLINERVWGEESNTNPVTGAAIGSGNSTDVQLDLAYATLKEFLYSPLTLTIGRQELHFGNDLIIGDVDTNGLMSGHGAAAAATGTYLPRSLDDLSLRKSFDAIRATLNYDPLVADLVYAKIDENFIDEQDDINLYGVNANYAVNKDLTTEGYYWTKEIKKASASTSTAVAGETGQQSLDDVTRTVGGRVQYNGLKNLMVGLEGAYQFGKYIKNSLLYPDEPTPTGAALRREAFAIQLVAQYNLADLIKKYEPMVSGSYTYLSGDKPKTVNTQRKFHGWNPMFENQAGGTLFNKILGYSNAQLYNISGSLKPLEDVTLALAYYYIRLNKAYPDDITAWNLTGIVGDPTYYMSDEKNLGHEFDVKLTYDYTEDVQIGLNVGWFAPGTAFKNDFTTSRAGNNETATQVIGSMKVTF